MVCQNSEGPECRLEESALRSSTWEAAVFVSTRLPVVEGEYFESSIATTAKEGSDGDKKREDDTEHDSILLTRRNVASPGRRAKSQLADFKPSWLLAYKAF